MSNGYKATKQSKRTVKKDRRMKVYHSSNYDYRSLIPMIKLSGAWVEDLGFQIGTTINVHCENGKLTITLAETV